MTCAPHLLVRYQEKPSIFPLILQKSYQEFYQPQFTHFMFPRSCAPHNTSYALCSLDFFFLLGTWTDWLSQPPLREGEARRLDSCHWNVDGSYVCLFQGGSLKSPHESLHILSLLSFSGWLYNIWWKALRPLENGDIVDRGVQVPISQWKATHRFLDMTQIQVRNNLTSLTTAVILPDEYTPCPWPRLLPTVTVNAASHVTDAGGRENTYRQPNPHPTENSAKKS